MAASWDVLNARPLIGSPCKSRTKETAAADSEACFFFFSSLQFAVLMWILTYVGALFNGLTLIILGELFPQCTGTLND